MELKDLAGPHVLTGADYGSVQAKSWDNETEACDRLRFTLDGITYSAVEDPEDGYRSSMRELVVSDDPTMNPIPPTRVVCMYIEKGNCEECDILTVVAVENGKTLITVGTRNTDDYYPYFIGEWEPKNLPCNEGDES